VLLLDPPCLLPKLLFGAGAEVVADRHAEPVGDEVGQAEDDHDAAGELRAGHAADDGERRHDAIDGPVDEVAQIAVTRTVIQTSTNRLGRVRRAKARRRRVCVGGCGL
jgi:hypothetical protein